VKGLKSIKQSRADRLERRRISARKAADIEKSLTEDQRVHRYNALLKKIEKQCERIGKKKCPHGFPFSGYDCLVCNADAIADRIREEWYPSAEYKLLIYDGEPGNIPLTLRTRSLVKKIDEMQKNGFWYPFRGSPVYCAPGTIRAVVVDGMVQNPGYIGPPAVYDLTRPEKPRREKQ
jgi:hypothetical protein